MNPDRNDQATVEELLKEAEALMHKDIEKEKKILESDPHGNIDDYEKYKNARAIFQEVLELDPGNERALKGVGICDLMSKPLPMVQYIVPTPTFDKNTVIVTADPVHIAKKAPPQKEDLPPWELRARAKQMDMEGLRYTGEQLGKAGKMAAAKIADLIEEARKKVAEDGQDPKTVLIEYSSRLRQFQENLHQEWKGHGPEILDEALEKLSRALGE